jgi:hypothetical protein
MVTDGPMDGETFLAYVHQFLCPTLQPGDTMILENLSSHKVTAVETAISATALEKRVAEGQLKDRHKIERSLGKIQARHPQVADLYEMKVVERGGTLRLEWQALPGRRSWRRARQGAYLLRTNLALGEPAQFWKSYIRLTEAEAAFRPLKSELSIRPIEGLRSHPIGGGAGIGGL